MNKYSFTDILTKEVEINNSTLIFDGIQIPIIQRDYAQGRKKELSIRNQFLKSIFKALKNNNNLELDFVYGSKRSIDNDQLFIPLDGQQRLTTLFLFNWYIGSRELKGDELADLRSILSKFTYATRSSSNKFCEKLSLQTISFTKFPSEEIKDSSWFFDTFKLDPTVQSMLVMLDAIHHRYEKLNLKLYPQLNNIKFYFLPLDGFDLTDELYIKMNARGKQLTSFENFKADLIKWIQNKKNPFKEDFTDTRKYKALDINYTLYFELKLDIEWTGLFWNYSKNNVDNSDKLVDPYMMQFFNRYMLNTYIISSTLNQSEVESDSKFKALYGNQGDDSKITYNDFDYYSKILEMHSKNKNRVYLIEKVLDSLTSHWKEINDLLAPNWNRNDNWNLFSKSINQRQRILLFATTVYLEQFTFDSEKFGDWIRIVWNIIIDPNIRRVPNMVVALRLVAELSAHSNDILDYFKNPASFAPTPLNGGYLKQLKEEHQKAILISKSKEWKDEIISAESHKLFQGNILFLLAEDMTDGIDSFRLFKKTAFEIFEDNDLTDKPQNYLWIRALLSKSSNTAFPFELTNGSFNRWRDMINGLFIKPFQLLLRETTHSAMTAKDCMTSICDNYTLDLSEEWKFPLVNWVGKNGETLLGNYSETRKIQEYNYYGASANYVYLYNKTVWTEGNIILNNNRNQVISAVISKCPEIKILGHDWHNIQESYFRGWSIHFKRKIDRLVFIYEFKFEDLIIKINYTPELEAAFPDFQVTDVYKENNWFYRKSYKFKDLEDEGIVSFIESIEKEIFDLENPQSIVKTIIKS